ncbi:HlyD family type I secretion periplasmic adaptor subunit [Devosia albogilva]|uniref:Membrane fusion protein (MFP) family protein n=1 Tax=Devosia albogilva TaxID=429726 RepID=A0ABW5QML2_9HYPH
MTTLDLSSPYGTSTTLAQRGRTKAGSSAFSLRGRVVAGSILALLLVGGIGGWSATAKLSGAVISTGSVLVDQNVKVVQHLDGGVVRSIAVRKGDRVAQGQILFTLDDIGIRTEQSILMGQLAELSARQARLLAERDGAKAIAFPAVYLANNPGAGVIMDGERTLFESTLQNRQSQRSQLELQITQSREEIAGLELQHTAMAEELALMREERERMGLLAEKGLIETNKINASDRELARMVGSQGELAASIARARARISEIELQILSIDELARTEAQRELRTIEARMAELADRLNEVNSRLERTVIRAPVAGSVNELSVTTLGGVITPAEKLLTIVPEDADLTIEFRVATSDIDQIEPGQPAKLRFSAFNQRVTPEIDATVSHVAAAAINDAQSGQSYYLATAEVTGDLSALGERGLVPGMPVEVFVQTDEQIAIAYLLKPFTDQISRAFKEE